MEAFKIIGGKPLNGEVEVRGSKNAALPIISASLLSEKPVVLDNIPLIEDVFNLLKIIESMGGMVEWLEQRKIRINSKDINPSKINQDLACKMRGSILLVAPLLVRFKEVKINEPGGCKIGTRSLGAHFEVFKSFGVEIHQDEKGYIFKREKLNPAKVVLPEMSVTATENALMIASGIKSNTEIKISAVEPHVQELIVFLNKLGAGITFGIDHTLMVKGVNEFNSLEYSIISDYLETLTFMVASAVTNGDIMIRNAVPQHLELSFVKLKEFGLKFDIKLSRNDADNYAEIHVYPSLQDLKSAKVQTLPHPGIPTDIQPVFGVLATQAQGESLIFDTLYDGRLKYLEELKKMGAECEKLDDHRAKIFGPTRLNGAQINSLDIRSGAALVLAGLSAQGETIINPVYYIDRGYEKIDERLRALGADIGRINLEF